MSLNNIVVREGEDGFNILDLEFKFEYECERAIKWQEQFDKDSKWAIKTKKEIKVLHKEGKLCKFGWTDKAWCEFIKNL